MSEKKAKELKEKLFYKKENGIDFLTEDELNTCDRFCDGYKDFLFSCKQNVKLPAGQKKPQKKQVFFRLMLSANR